MPVCQWKVAQFSPRPLFCIQYKFYNDELPKTETTKHYTTLQGQYQEEQKYNNNNDNNNGNFHSKQFKIQ